MKSALLAALALKTEPVVVNGVTFIVSEIGASDYIRIWTDKNFQDAAGNIDMSKFTPALIACAVVDEDGNRVFSDSDVVELSRASYSGSLKIAAVAKRLNGVEGEEIKNSEAGPTDSLPIDSACSSDSDTPTN
jgi:hypothetical protein